jgi:pyridinium-3,5-biscarboxylic acid mononucleotide sulfurtransferase
MSRIRQLEERIAALDTCVVAFSGGVDSSLVAALAARALGDRALAVTAVSPAVATGEVEGAKSVSRAIGIAHLLITTAELSREGYVRNGPDRCYHCKTELYHRLAALAARRGYAALL